VTAISSSHARRFARAGLGYRLRAYRPRRAPAALARPERRADPSAVQVASGRPRPAGARVRPRRRPGRPRAHPQRAPPRGAARVVARGSGRVVPERLDDGLPARPDGHQPLRPALQLRHHAVRRDDGQVRAGRAGTEVAHETIVHRRIQRTTEAVNNVIRRDATLLGTVLPQQAPCRGGIGASRGSRTRTARPVSATCGTDHASSTPFRERPREDRHEVDEVRRERQPQRRNVAIAVGDDRPTIYLGGSGEMSDREIANAIAMGHVLLEVDDSGSPSSRSPISTTRPRSSASTSRRTPARRRSSPRCARASPPARRTRPRWPSVAAAPARLPSPGPGRA
jgi:hypothetical protein